MTLLLPTPEFKLPSGVNYHLLGPEPIGPVVRALQRIAVFLQDLDPYAGLMRIDDWWQHDGLYFYRDTTDLHTLFETVESPQSLLRAMPGDDWVCIGIARDDGSWYLRLYADWSEGGWTLEGYFDMTLREDLAMKFEREALPEFGLHVERQDADAYYDFLNCTVFR